jgi:hypothetical protein
MWKDEIVEEVRAARAKLMAQYGNDLEALFRALQEREKSSGDREVVSLPSRPPVTSSHSAA